MTTLRRLGAAILAIAAVVVWFTMAPGTTPATSHARAVSAALADAQLNNASAEGAPQQAVVSGWVARDLLAVVTHEQDQLIQEGKARDRRPAALLLIGVLGIALLGVTSSAPGGDEGSRTRHEEQAE